MKKILFEGNLPQNFMDKWKCRGYEIFTPSYGRTLSQYDRAELIDLMASHCIEGIFSFDFSPWIAEICHEVGALYISWVVDSPHAALWAKSVRYEENYIFIFDYRLYERIIGRGIKHVFYLPLSANIETFQNTIRNADELVRKQYQEQVTMVANLYNDEAHSRYDQIHSLTPYVKGYLEALMKAQMGQWDIYLLEDFISGDVWRQLREMVKLDLNDKYEPVYEVNFSICLAQKVAQMERKAVCDYLTEHFSFKLYTDCDTGYNAAIRNMGHADYENQMPLIFHYSRININMTLHCITTGIPLRVMDVLACEGFLLTNYQMEIAEYFEDGVELVMYESFQDLYNKIEYYLEHEEERRKIAHAGYLKVREQFNYEIAVDKMEQCIEEENE